MKDLHGYKADIAVEILNNMQMLGAIEMSWLRTATQRPNRRISASCDNHEGNNPNCKYQNR